MNIDIILQLILIKKELYIIYIINENQTFNESDK